MAIALVLLLSTVAFVSLKGSRVLMTLFAVELGAGPFETGMLFALYGLFPFLLAISAGRIADRLGNHVLMYAGFAGFAFTLPLPALFPSLPMLFVAAPLVGFTSMLFIVATMNSMLEKLQLLQPRGRHRQRRGAGARGIHDRRL